MRAPNPAGALVPPPPKLFSLAAHFRQVIIVDGIAELGDAAVEFDPDLAGRTVALLGDDDFRLAVRASHLFLPPGKIGMVVGRLLRREIIILAIDEEHYVGVLLDRA